MKILKIIASIVLLSIGFNLLNVDDDLTVGLGMTFITGGLWIIYTLIKQLLILLTKQEKKNESI